MECDDECDRAEVVQQDYLARMRAFTAGCRHSLDFSQVLEGRRFFLSMQETDLERREEKLAEEQACGLYSFNGRDLLAELEELRGHVAGVGHGNV
jgi:flavoprotein